MKVLVFLLTAAVMAGVSSQGIGQQQQQRAQTAPATHYSRAELKAMMREAHTPQQYQALASYFRQRQEIFQRHADDLKKEWERRSQNVTGPAAKPPRPVDSARNLYEYYSYEANQMGVLAVRYESQLNQQPTRNE